MHLVQAIDDAGGVRPVLALFEGVCTAAADGYARIAGRPAMTLLHLGPGMANGIANLHNASRARTPVLSVVGEHATFHRGRGAPLETDIEALAGPFSKWVRTSAAPADVAADAAEAVAAARPWRGGRTGAARAAVAAAAAGAVAAARPARGGVATLIVPAAGAGSEAPGPADPIEPAPARRVPDAAVEAAAGRLAAAAERP